MHSSAWLRAWRLACCAGSSAAAATAERRDEVADLEVRVGEMGEEHRVARLTCGDVGKEGEGDVKLAVGEVVSGEEGRDEGVAKAPLGVDATVDGPQWRPRRVAEARIKGAAGRGARGCGGGSRGLRYSAGGEARDLAGARR
jgi:hypothetical protein